MKNRLFFCLLLGAALLGSSLPAFSASSEDIRARVEARRAESLARRAAPAAPAAPSSAPSFAPVPSPTPNAGATSPAATEPVIEKIDKLTLADVQDKLVVTPDLIWQVRDQTLLYDLKKAWEDKQNQLAGEK